MAGFQPAFDLKVYVSALLRVANRLLRAEIWPWLVLALGLSALLWLRWRTLTPLLCGMILFVAGVLVGRFLVFPLPDSRIALPWVTILTVVACACIVRQGKAGEASER